MPTPPGPGRLTGLLAMHGLGWGALTGTVTAALAIAIGVSGDSAGSGSTAELLLLLAFYGVAVGAPIGAVVGLLAGIMVGVLHAAFRGGSEPREARSAAVSMTSLVLALPVLLLASVGGAFVLVLLVVPIAAWRMNRTLASLTAPQPAAD